MYSPLSDADETEEPVERLGDSEGDPCIDIPPERVSEENPYSNIIPKEDPHSNGPQEDSYSNSHQEDPCTYNTEENPCIESRPDGVVDTSTPEPNEPFDSDMATPLIEPSRPLHGIDIGDGTLSKIKDRIRERKSKVEVPNASSGMLEAMIQWLRSYYDSLFRITFILLLLLIERVVQDKLFVCPCKSTQLNRVYSIAFMVVPAIVLFGSGERLLSLQWRHNERDGVSNHRRLDCLLHRLFSRSAKKTSKDRVTGLCGGNLPVTGEFPAQMASNAENVSISWRHRVLQNTESREPWFQLCRHKRSCYIETLLFIIRLIEISLTYTTENLSHEALGPLYWIALIENQ